MRTGLVLLISALWAVAAASDAIDPGRWQMLTPGNTGIPGEQILFSKFDPAGRLWVGARSPFSRHGGVGIWDGTRWTTYSSLDSPLPSGDVCCAAFEAGGAAWLGTGGGLVRLEDGYWSLYTSANSPLPADIIRNVLLDAAGHLWLIYDHAAGLGCGVAMLSGREWSVWTAPQLGFSADVQLGALACDGYGQIWVGTRNKGGVARYDWQNWAILDAEHGYSSAPATALATGADSTLWLNWNGIKRYDGYRWSNLTLDDDTSQYTTLAVDEKGRLWTGTAAGELSRFDGKWQRWPVGGPVRQIDFDAAGNPWCTDLAQVRSVREEDGNAITYSHFNTGLTDGRIRDIAFDQDGQAWVATATGGLCLYDGVRWRDFNPQNNGAEPWPFATYLVEDVLAASDGSVWTALGESGAARWDGAVWTPYLESYHVTCLAEDAAGRVWVGFMGGAGVVDGDQITTFNSWNGLPAGYVGSIASDSEGTVWLGTTAGLVRYDGNSFVTVDLRDAGLSDNTVTALLAADDGALWVGTAAGLARFKGGAWTAFTEGNAGLPGGAINAVVRTPDGMVWVGAADRQLWPARGGLAHYDGAAWQTLSTDNSLLPEERVECLALDAHGHLWIGTAREGIAIFKLGTAPEVMADRGDSRADGFDHF